MTALVRQRSHIADASFTLREIVAFLTKRKSGEIAKKAEKHSSNKKWKKMEQDNNEYKEEQFWNRYVYSS